MVCLASPTQRSLKVLRDDGWLCDIVERWIPGANIRKDLFGIGDIIAIKPGVKPKLIQVTSTGVSARIKKIQLNNDLETVLSVFNLEVHGWRKNVKNRFVQRIVTIT